MLAADSIDELETSNALKSEDSEFNRRRELDESEEEGCERTSEHVPASSGREVDAARILHRMCETFNTVHRANQFSREGERKNKTTD